MKFPSDPFLFRPPDSNLPASSKQALRAESERQKRLAARINSELGRGKDGLVINNHRPEGEQPVYIHQDLECFLKRVGGNKLLGPFPFVTVRAWY